MAAASFQHYRPLKMLNREGNVLKPVQLQCPKRKTAVELLQETKPLYVKSEMVLDSKQALSRCSHPSLLAEDVFCDQVDNDVHVTDGHHRSHYYHFPGSTLPTKSCRLTAPPPSFRKSTNSLQLEKKLRKLLNADSKENLSDSSPSDKGAQTSDLSCDKVARNKCQDVHKSMPDLSAVPNSSSGGVVAESDKSDDGASFGFPLCSISSDGVGRKSAIIECNGVECTNEYVNFPRDKIRFQDHPASFDYVEETFSSPTSPIKSCISYITPPSMYRDAIKCRPGVERSKSDVGEYRRFSLHAVDILPSPNSTTDYDHSTDIFFDHLGMDVEHYKQLMAPRSHASTPVFFTSDDSSIDSVGGASYYTSEGNRHQTYMRPEALSIVERNARIIKWLCACRKAF